MFILAWPFANHPRVNSPTFHKNGKMELTLSHYSKACSTSKYLCQNLFLKVLTAILFSFNVRWKGKEKYVWVISNLFNTPFFFLAILLKSTFSHNGITALEWDRGQGSARYAHSRSQHYGMGHTCAWPSAQCSVEEPAIYSSPLGSLTGVWDTEYDEGICKACGRWLFFLTSDSEKNKTELDHSWWYVVQDKGTSIAANPLRRFQPQWSVMQRTDDYKDLPGTSAVCSLPGTIIVNNAVLYSTTEHWL